MARGKPVILESMTFPRKADALQYFREMLNRYRVGDRVADADAILLHQLLERHTEKHEKIGIGISHFEVMRGDYGTQCFRAVRNDGSGTDFSYVHCISANPE